MRRLESYEPDPASPFGAAWLQQWLRVVVVCGTGLKMGVDYSFVETLPQPQKGQSVVFTLGPHCVTMAILCLVAIKMLAISDTAIPN
jgi:hypothetical protein